MSVKQKIQIAIAFILNVLWVISAMNLVISFEQIYAGLSFTTITAAQKVLIAIYPWWLLFPWVTSLIIIRLFLESAPNSLEKLLIRVTILNWFVFFVISWILIFSVRLPIWRIY